MVEAEGVRLTEHQRTWLERIQVLLKDGVTPRLDRHPVEPNRIKITIVAELDTNSRS